MVNGFYKEFLKVVSNLNPNSIVDAACGEGFTLDRLDKAGYKDQVVGFDGSLVAINLGKALFPQLSLFVANTYQIPCEDNSFDLVVCTEALEHMKHPDTALHEMKRISRRHLLLSVPNEPFFSLKNLVVGRNVKRWGSSKGHINWWTSQAFERMVAEQGLTPKYISHPFPFTLLLAEK